MSPTPTPDDLTVSDVLRELMTVTSEELAAIDIGPPRWWHSLSLYDPALPYLLSDADKQEIGDAFRTALS